MMTPNTKIETVSKYIHNMWMSWAKTILETEPKISAVRKQRWEDECFKPYEELSEEMKQRDRDFAIKIIELINNERKK